MIVVTFKLNSPLWRALFRAIVTRDRGYRQKEGYTRNLLESPAKPYPMRLVDSASRIWYKNDLAYFCPKYLSIHWVKTEADISCISHVIRFVLGAKRRMLEVIDDILIYLELGIVDPTLAMMEMSICSF